MRGRLKRAGVPVEYQTARTKPEIALAEIDRMMSVGVRFGCVVADAGYGPSAPFRGALRLASLPGRSASLVTSRYIVGVQLILANLCTPKFGGGPVSGTCQIFYR